MILSFAQRWPSFCLFWQPAQPGMLLGQSLALFLFQHTTFRAHSIFLSASGHRFPWCWAVIAQQSQELLAQFPRCSLAKIIFWVVPAHLIFPSFFFLFVGQVFGYFHCSAKGECRTLALFMTDSDWLSLYCPTHTLTRILLVLTPDFFRIIWALTLNSNSADFPDVIWSYLFRSVVCFECWFMSFCLWE